MIAGLSQAAFGCRILKQGLVERYDVEIFRVARLFAVHPGNPVEGF
jgi:hypothetical protein